MLKAEVLKIIIYILGGISFTGLLPLMVIPTRKWNAFQKFIEICMGIAAVFFLLSFFAIFMYAGAIYVKVNDAQIESMER